MNGTVAFNVSINVTEGSNNHSDNEENEYDMYPMEWVAPVTVIYGIIFVTGLLGNITTCIVIAKNKYMHTATNFYLFSLAISDLLLLISGLPAEMYRIWFPDNYTFGQAFCIIQGFAAETSCNATVLTITAFTVERYVAICHPFLSHTIAKLSRIIKFIVAIWLMALSLAIPQAIQFGVVVEDGSSNCMVVTEGFFKHSFEISSFVFFVVPMTLITVLYILIAIKLRKSRLLGSVHQPSIDMSTGGHNCRIARRTGSSVAQKKVIKMLVAVVTAFFVCWAPFHAQRLIALYLVNATPEQQNTTFDAYVALVHISGVLYYLSTSINPLLYNIMSNKFREAFKTTLAQLCNRGYESDGQTRKYSVLSRYPPSMRTYQRSASEGVHHTQITTEIKLDEGVKKYYRSAPNSRQPSSANMSPRLLTQSSQSIVLANLSKSIKSDAKNKIEDVLLPTPTVKPKQSKKGTRTRETRSFWEKCTSIFRFVDNGKTRDEMPNKESVDIGNTISNSSLQDMDEMEYSSSDLVKYMEEVNEDIT